MFVFASIAAAIIAQFDFVSRGLYSLRNVSVLVDFFSAPGIISTTPNIKNLQGRILAYKCARENSN